MPWRNFRSLYFSTTQTTTILVIITNAVKGSKELKLRPVLNQTYLINKYTVIICFI